MINQLPDKLKNDIIEYCKLNKIDDINSFIIKMIRQSLTIEMYGRVPKIFDEPEAILSNEIEIKPSIEEIKVEVSEKEKIDAIISTEEKNKYEINLDLNKNPEPIIQETPKINKDEDIYGESGWFGGSNLYDLTKKKK
jgi:hypothetical protein